MYETKYRKNNLFRLFKISKEKPLDLCITDLTRPMLSTFKCDYTSNIKEKWRWNKNDLWTHSLVVMVVLYETKYHKNNLFGLFIISKEKPLDLCIINLRDPCSPHLKGITQATSKRSGERIKTTCGGIPWWSRWYGGIVRQYITLYHFKRKTSRLMHN